MDNMENFRNNDDVLARYVDLQGKEIEIIKIKSLYYIFAGSKLIERDLSADNVIIWMANSSHKT